MKRIQEKVKDVVEVRKFLTLRDFTSDASETLAGYHFTDATSELMSNWLDNVAGLMDGRGGAFALAGYRGVGKSHFLCVLGAIAGHPELRTKITDSHVGASAQASLRRRYPIGMVRRGSQATLVDELRSAVAETFSEDLSKVPGSVLDIMAFCRKNAGEVPMILLVDTAVERSSRVTRDDGATLSEIAEAAKELNIFVGAALDDDIAGADGTNAAIVRSFKIDYLDQDHLYKVVDSFVFPKNNQMRPVLHDVYEYFRAVMPTFKWSEQKFSSLYPLHPAILDIAPFVRLYVQNFALLGFASDAGEKILGRPANSLIALDEVFDHSEKELRHIEDLRDAFAAFDKLNSEVVAKIPVMQRLQAKLVLKALLLLSLEGQGTTAGEIASGMLIFDENDPTKANRTVEELIRTFAAALPEEVQVIAEPEREVRYGLRVSSKENLHIALEAAAAKLDESIVTEVLHRNFHERFNDSTFYSLDGSKKNSAESVLNWRGGSRCGRIFWSDGVVDNSVAGTHDAELHDWEVAVTMVEADPWNGMPAADIPRVIWKAALLTKDETSAIRRFHILNSDVSFRDEFGDQIRGSLHSHGIILDRIVNRIFLDDGLLVIDKFDYNFTEDARAASTFTDLFSTMLEPLFEVRYPKHPYFLGRLGIAEVSTLVSDLFSGSRQKLAEVQQLAQTFALPLGLVKLTDGVYLPSDFDAMNALETVQMITALVDAGGKDGVQLSTVYSELKRPPLGLVREAQQLILATMVSQRMVEFVTSKGDRINHRSIDLKLIWDDISGLARPHESTYSAKRLVKWAAAFAGDEFKSFESASSIALLKTALTTWLETWDGANVTANFALLPPDAINTGVWRSAVRCSNTLGTAADNIRNYLSAQIGAEDCFGQISDAFLDDISNFEFAEAELRTVASYVAGFEQRSTIKAYLAAAEFTGAESVESCRDILYAALERFDAQPNDARSREIGYLWAKYQRDYGEAFVEKHDSVMRSPDLQSKLRDFIESDEWWHFQNLARYAGGELKETTLVMRTYRQASESNCAVDTKAKLAVYPYCDCGYELSRHAFWENLPEKLRSDTEMASLAIKSSLYANADALASSVEALLPEMRPENSALAVSMISFLRSGTLPVTFEMGQLQIIERALEAMQSSGINVQNEAPATTPYEQINYEQNNAERVESGDVVVIG